MFGQHYVCFVQIDLELPRVETCQELVKLRAILCCLLFVRDQGFHRYVARSLSVTTYSSFVSDNLWQTWQFPRTSIEHHGLGRAIPFVATVTRHKVTSNDITKQRFIVARHSSLMP